MSIAAFEQRLQILEVAVANLRSQQSAREPGRTGEPTDGEIPYAEQPLVPAVPPKQQSRWRAKLSCVQPGPPSLGLSQAEWIALDLREADE